MALCCGSRRQSLLILALFSIILFVLFYKQDDLPDVPQLPAQLRRKPPAKAKDRLAIEKVDPEQLKKVHLLLPASSGKVNLCKTLLTASVLGYPVPNLISYDTTFENEKIIGGGRHVAKIEKILEWLEKQPESINEDLVLVVDAYGGFNYHADKEAVDAHMEGDVWFQLPLEVLVQRYHAVNAHANAELQTRLGEAYQQEGIKQDIIFGASKQCTPSDPESSSCYPVPESPLPKNLYGKYTDKMSYNHTTHRPRYLSSAYTIGPVGSMRNMFRRANEKAARARDPVESDDTSFDDALEVGSDQAIFSHMFGEQEFQREVLRRKYGGDPKARGKTTVEGTKIEDVLEPGIPHEVLTQNKEGHPDEFGIGLDYWSDIGMSTSLSEDDGRWLTYHGHTPQQILSRQRKPWSCAPHVDGLLPIELMNSTGVPRTAASDASQFSPAHGWDEVPLYTNVCVDTIPVLINHAGDKAQRERAWPELWLQPHAARLIDEVLDREEGDKGEIRGGAYVGAAGVYQGWKKLCPKDVEGELYNDVWDEPSRW